MLDAFSLRNVKSIKKVRSKGRRVLRFAETVLLMSAIVIGAVPNNLEQTSRALRMSSKYSSGTFTVCRTPNKP
jgi:hypothetical protein